MINSSVDAFLLYASLFLLVLLVVKLKISGEAKYKLPPSPSSFPFIGNLHQIRGSARHALRSLATKHGGLMLLHLGQVPTVVISSANVARDATKIHDLVFSSRPVLSIPIRLTYGKDIAFSPYGEHWRQARKICVLKILSAHRVQSFRPVREEESAFLMEKIISESSFSKSLLNLSEFFVSFTNSIMCRVAFGGTYGSEEHVRKFMKMIREFTNLCAPSNLADVIPSLSWLNDYNGLNKRVEKNFREIDSFLDEVIEDHIQKKRSNNYGDCEHHDEDIVDLMLGLEEDNTLGIQVGRDTTKAIILDMFAGGTDTTSIVLEWTISELLRHPEIMEEVQKEVRDIARGKLVLKEADTEEMHLLQAVIKETLRLHPPAPIFVRETTEDVKLHGFNIPAKMRITFNVFAINRDPTMWENQEEFLPKRFLKGRSAAVDFRGQDFQFIPFGVGRRGCPGMTFAMAETNVALANLLNRFVLMLPEGISAKDFDMTETSGITSYRKNELLLRVKPHY